ncbi:hypothetical protein B0J14DRAFT_305982 [Halenospora varia]|nr:hypothetical protein B0J14DRAFT_305982 [Halenospora varia]
MYLARQAPPPPPDFGPNALESHGKMILGITGGFTAFATLVVALRMYVRAVILKTMGPDDYVMIFATLCSVSAYVLFVGEVKYGVGEHFTNPHLLANYTQVLHWSYHHGWIIVVGISSVKLSIGFFLLRLVQKPLYKKFVIGWMIFLFVFTLACLGTLVFQCIPIDAAWDFSLRFDPNSKCYNLGVFRSIGLFNGAINIFTDFLFASLPIPVILSLKINMRTKISLICILGLGYFACVAAIIKEVVLSNFFKNTDNLFNNAFNIWNDIELNMGILAACLPALRPLFAKFLETAQTTLANSGIRSRPSMRQLRPKASQTLQRKKSNRKLRMYPTAEGPELLLSTKATNKSEDIGVQSVTSRTTTNSGVQVEGGMGLMSPEQEKTLWRQDSGASIESSNQLEKDIEVGESAGAMARAHLRREKERLDRRDTKARSRSRGRSTETTVVAQRRGDLGMGGILKTTEFSVTR